MNIYNSQIEDIDHIFELYKTATDYQNKKFTYHQSVKLRLH